MERKITLSKLTVHDFQSVRQLALEVGEERRVPGRHLFLAVRTHPIELVDDAGPMPLHFLYGAALGVWTLLFLGHQAVLLEPFAQVALAAYGQQRFDGRLEEIRIVANARHDGLQTTEFRVRTVPKYAWCMCIGNNRTTVVLMDAGG